VPERDEHIKAIRNGAPVFEVLCFAKIEHKNLNERRRIAGFDRHRLPCLGAISEDDKAIYATFAGYISTGELFDRGV
jgi:hypothetical protein